MNYQIINAPQLLDLQDKVRTACTDGWQPLGAPFREEAKLQWCQAMTRSAPLTKSGEVKLKEPKR